MRNTCIFILAFLFSQHVNAQGDIRLGVQGGLSVPNLRAPDNGSFSSGYKSLSGPYFGVLAEYAISPSFSIQTEINYSTQGGRKEGPQRIRTKDVAAYLPSGFSIPDSIPYIYATFNNQIDLVYIELPLMAKYGLSLSENLRLTIYAGPYIGYLIKGKAAADGQSKVYTDAAHTQPLTFKINNTNYELPAVDFTRTEDIKDRLNRFNYGIQAGGSIEYSFPAFDIFFAAGGTYGLATLQKDEGFGVNKTGGALVSIGAALKL